MNRRGGGTVAAVMMFLVALASCDGRSTAGSRTDAEAAAGGGNAALPSTAPRGQAIATFAGGCFWCVESEFEKVPGVLSVVSGFTGGETRNPTYDQVSSGRTRHAEAVRITYDPAKVTYAKLLDVLWHNIDPTQANAQFCDRGRQYRSAIFWHDSTQRRLAERSKQALAKSGVLPGPVVTEIVAAGPFYPAEEYHQDFYKKDPDRYHSYREGCGRDRRLRQLWGKEASASGSTSH